MGKLTGLSSSSQPPPSEVNGGGANGKNSNGLQNKNEEGGGNDISANSTPASNGSSNSEQKIQISLSNSNRSARRRSSRGLRHNKRDSFTGSMKEAVNKASETARLVMDNAVTNEIMGDDGNRSVGSHGSFSRTSSHGSSHSIRSVGSNNSINSLGSGGGGSIGGGGRNASPSGANEIYPIGEKAEQQDAITMEGDTDDNNSPSISKPFSSFGPPAMAFQNLPMMTHGSDIFASSSSDAKPNNSNNTNSNSNSEILSEGKIFEVTNHFDAAAAISAALASSSLARAGGNYGELQSSFSSRRRSTISVSDDIEVDLFGGGRKSPGDSFTSGATGEQPFRRSNSGDAITALAAYYADELGAGSGGEVDEISRSENWSRPLLPLDQLRSYRPTSQKKGKGLPTPEEAERQMLHNRHMNSFFSVDDLSFETEDGGGDQNLILEDKKLNAAANVGNEEGGSGQKQQHRRTGSGALPTFEEAEAEMLSNRASFVSSVDSTASFELGSIDEKLQGKIQQVLEGEKEMGESKMKRNDSLDEMMKASGGEPAMEMTNDEKQLASSLAAAAQHNFNQSDMSIDVSSSGYDNESNTSSYGASNANNSGYSSDVSPITMSSSENKNAAMGGVGGGVNNKKGMLGNLAKHRAGLMAEGMAIADEDEYSMNSSENSTVVQGAKQQQQQKQLRRNSKPKKKTVTFVPNSLAYAPARTSKKGVDESNITTASSSAPDAKLDHHHTLPHTSNEEHYLNMQKQYQTAHPHSAPAPSHRASLFDSFDRNWEQAFDSEELLDLGRKCLVSFAIVFGPCVDGVGRSIFNIDSAGAASGDNNAGEEGKSSFCWWMDDDALTKTSPIFAKGNTKGIVSEGQQEVGNQSDVPGGIPNVVVRALWRTCFFDEDTAGDGNDAVERSLDVIQQTLVKELCYLSTTNTPSSGAIPCLRLSLDVYAEYGRYLLQRLGLPQDMVSTWHSKFAFVLRNVLLDGSLTDAEVQRRYAIQSLPRHTALGYLAVDSDTGNYQSLDAMKLSDEKRSALRTDLFENLLCNETFVKCRIELLGRGNTRCHDVDEILMNAVAASGEGDGGPTDQIVKSIKQIRDNDRNSLLSTTAHMKDIEWCASLLHSVSDQDNKVGEGSVDNNDTGLQDEKDEGSCLFANDCVLDAMTIWKEELLTSFSVLHDAGKLTIFDHSDSNDKTAANSKSKVATRAEDAEEGATTGAANTHLAQLMMHSTGTTEGGESYTQIASTLFTTEDAWTMKEDCAAQLFAKKGGTSSSSTTSPRPKKGRRKKEGTASTATTDATTTPLARALGIAISDLRTAVSVGRSFIGLAEFSEYMLRKLTNNSEKLKDSSSASSVTSRLWEIQFSSLKSAIDILSITTVTLSCILSKHLDKLDDEDLDIAGFTNSGPYLQLFALTRESSEPLLSIAGMLCADAWFMFGKLNDGPGPATLGGVGGVGGGDDHIMLFSYKRALLILNSPKSLSLNKLAALDKSCKSLLSPLTQYKCYLQSNINHAIGVYSYEQGEFDRAADYLNKSSTFRRGMLDDLRDHHGNNEDEGNTGGNGDEGLSKFFKAVVGGMKSSSNNGKSNCLASPSSMPPDVLANIFKYSVSHCIIQLPQEIFAIEELELSLSLTLEYSALTQHAGQRYQQALSYFQESLILRTMHVGKHSLDVASLHFNMGVVYDDLEQYDQAISRYHESLRIRLDQKAKAEAALENISELEDSVMLTLKCMGHVYKIINDLDNAVCCYVKALQMVNSKFSNYQNEADDFSKMGLRLSLAVPVPTVMFDDMKASSGNTSWKATFQSMNKKELCHVFEPRPAKRRSHASKLKKELVKLHTTIIDLVHERKQTNWDNESTGSRQKVPGSSLLLASLSSIFKTGGDAFEAALMRSSFSLGRMRLEQMRYEDAANYLETALRSKWVLDPASSSDSDSDFSRSRSLSSQSKQYSSKKSTDEDDPEEGQIYYALGICNAALDDHERAVRCFLTAMRYLRRSLRKVDSLEVARVLFDCATSHYYLCNFDQSVSLYNECLRILDSYDTHPSTDEENDGEKTPSTAATDDVSKRLRRGIVLYCLVIAKAAIDFDSDTSNFLNEAQTLLSGCNDRIILAYMEFLTGLFLHHVASQVPVRLRSITRITPTGLSSNEGLSWDAMCQSALTLFEQVKNECWFDPVEGVEDSDEVKHLPLSGHICFKKGQVYELIGSIEPALNSYVDAANFYRIACGDENMYVASVLHRLGIISSQRTEYHSLGYFNEALTIRKQLLGGNDRLVAETLYASAVVLARLNRYEASMERYHGALRIQMAESQDSNEVARTLSGMGICHYSHRAYDLALTCLEGAVKIRKYRVSRLTDSSELAELYGEEVALGADFFNLGNVQFALGDYAQAMQCTIQSRDLRWRHVGSGTVDKILDKYFSETTVDEGELLGLAHCLHNIGVMFDIKKEYNRSLPHYEEALAIKNAIAGFSTRDSMSLVEQVNPEESRALVLQSLHKDHKLPRINNATLSAAVTRQKIASVYVKRGKYDHALFHFSHALKIQRHVLGKDNFRIGSILSSMGNVLRRTSRHSDTAILCYNESLRISKLRFGQNHAAVASALFDIGSLYDSNQKFNEAMHYYRRAMSVYKQKYSQNLRQRLCSGFDLDRPRALNGDDGEGSTEILSTGDEIVVAGDSSVPENKIREQYALVTEALRNAKQRDMINRGERVSCVGDSNDAWLTFEVLLFRFVEMLSTWVVDPTQAVVRDAIDGSRRRIESAAAHAVISAADALDYQFLLLLQE